MGKQTFDGTRKILCTLMVIFFVTSVTSASVSAFSWSSVGIGSNRTILVADFTASPRSGNASLPVQFTDLSTVTLIDSNGGTSQGTPTSWKWTFGDGETSTERSPPHVYNKAGQYTVSLTVTYKSQSGGMSQTMIQKIAKWKYITVYPPLPDS